MLMADRLVYLSRLVRAPPYPEVAVGDVGVGGKTQYASVDDDDSHQDLDATVAQVERLVDGAVRCAHHGASVLEAQALARSSIGFIGAASRCPS